MSLTQLLDTHMEVQRTFGQIRDRPVYVGLNILALFCILLLIILLVTNLLGMDVDFVIPSEILAASAVIFAVAAYYRSKAA